MPATDHPSTADLQAFVLGMLPDATQLAVESHLSACPVCQQAAAMAPDDALVTLLRSAETSQAGPVTPGTGFAETVGLSQAADLRSTNSGRLEVTLDITTYYLAGSTGAQSQ